MSLQNRSSLTDIEDKPMVARGGAGRMLGRDSKGVLDGHVHTALFKTDNQHGSTVWHQELYSMFCGSMHGRRVWGRMDTCICMTESLCCLPESITTLLIGYQFSSVAQSCSTLCDPINCSIPGLPVHHQL